MKSTQSHGVVLCLLTGVLNLYSDTALDLSLGSCHPVDSFNSSSYFVY